MVIPQILCDTFFIILYIRLLYIRIRTENHTNRVITIITYNYELKCMWGMCEMGKEKGIKCGKYLFNVGVVTVIGYGIRKVVAWKVPGGAIFVSCFYWIIIACMNN